MLLHTCGQLLLRLADNSAEISGHDPPPPGHLLTYFDELTLEQLAKQQCSTTKFSLRIPSKPGDTAAYLAYFSVICLELFLRFNDGVNNSVLTADKHSNNNSVFVLNEFTEVLFNKAADGRISKHLQVVYVKFLSKLLVLNFKNLQAKTSNRNRDT